MVDPTYGRIDPDIQQYVTSLNPTDLGQRVAIENTLQQRRFVPVGGIPAGHEDCVFGQGYHGCYAEPRGTLAERLRLRIGYALGWPFWRIGRLAERVTAACQWVDLRFVNWAERSEPAGDVQAPS